VTLQANTSLGTIEPTITSGKPGAFPLALTLTAGTTTGTALVGVSAFYCAPDAVGAFGVCSDPQAQQNTCTAELSIAIGDADQPPPAQEAPKEVALAASLSCAPPAPVEKGLLDCTVQVEGARDNEALAFTWYVDSTEVATTAKPTWTWGEALAGKHDIGVDVAGDARSTRQTIEVDVQPAQQEVQEPVESQAPALPPPGGAQPPSSQGGAQEAAPAQGAGGVDDRALQQQDDRPFKPSPGEGYGEGSEDVRVRGRVEALIEGASSRAPAPGRAAVAGALTGAAVIGKLILDLEALRNREKRVRDAAPDLSAYEMPERAPAALRQGVEARVPEAPPVQGDLLGIERAARSAAADAQAHAKAVEKGRQELERVVNSVPPALRESPQWKQHIAPLLDRAKAWTDTSRIRALSAQIKAIVEVRRRIEESPTLRALPVHQQEALIWYRRTGEVFGDAVKHLNEVHFIDPALKVVKPVPVVGKPIVRGLEQHRKESAEFIERMKNLPLDAVGNGFRAQQRQQGDDPITRDLWQFKRQKRTFETGTEKLQRWRREFGEWWDRVRFGIHKGH
jgi:hypothetical protein